MNKQLSTVDATDAKRRWRENLPVSIKQMAVAIEIKYGVARKWAKDPAFPLMDGFVFPRLFEEWSRQRFKRPAHRKARVDALEDRQRSSAGKSDESPQMRDLPAALPLRAARLLAEVS